MPVSALASQFTKRLTLYPVFGVELEVLLTREAPNGEIQPGAIPAVIERLISEVENRGLQDTGICMFLVCFGEISSADVDVDRMAGAHSEVNAFKEALNRGMLSSARRYEVKILSASL